MRGAITLRTFIVDYPDGRSFTVTATSPEQACRRAASVAGGYPPGCEFYVRQEASR